MTTNQQEKLAAIADEAWLKQAEAHVLTPLTDRVLPVAIFRTEGQVENATALLRPDGASCCLVFEPGGPQPVVILDFGRASVGGYTVFSVAAKKGTPVVRLAYACHPDGLCETGCFSRESSARYLGETFDLPVLPGNVNRHELYTIPRTGSFIAPLIQGQTRYIRLQLDSPGSVEISAVVIVNSAVYDRSPHDGHFLCSDERLNRLWYISTWTLQIASFPNHDAWKTVDGWLLPRKLEQGDDIGLSVTGSDWRDVVIETTFELRINPHHVSAAGVAFRAQDAHNAYLVEFALDGKFRLIRRQDGLDSVLREKLLDTPLLDGVRYNLTLEAHGAILTTRLDGVKVDETRDGSFLAGRVGFYTPKEKWPLFDAVRVTNNQGQTLLFDDFEGDLSQWQFARTLPYVADGAKRDRLVWSGDLYFAQRNVYYAFANPLYMHGSLKMLAFSQTPEGYVHAAPYPECRVAPASGEYGPFPSDEFAAWLIPVAWDHLLYTGDSALMREMMPAIQRLLGYLRSHTGPDGVFVQRRETSKHAGDLNLGDVRQRAYMNILLWQVFTDASRIAEHLNMTAECQAASQTAQVIRRTLFEKFWDEAGGYFIDALETPTFGFEANALALAAKLVSPEQAVRMAPRLIHHGHGKFQSLASRGKFEYGFAQSGLRAIFDHNWLKLIEESWAGVTATTECMGLSTNGWGDDSHPDTAIADHFSPYILGVQPLAPGYRRFQVRPLPVQEVTWARGRVPTPHGVIEAGWELSGTSFRLTLTVPQGILADVLLPEVGNCLINGKKGALCDLKPGRYEIELSHLPAGAWSDPTLAAMVLDTRFLPLVKAESATEMEIDLGCEIALAKIVLLPDGEARTRFPRELTVQLARESGAFTTVAKVSGQPAAGSDNLSVDLYTVIGCPPARYVRLTVLGDEPNGFRLALNRIQWLRP